MRPWPVCTACILHCYYTRDKIEQLITRLYIDHSDQFTTFIRLECLSVWPLNDLTCNLSGGLVINKRPNKRSSWNYLQDIRPTVTDLAGYFFVLTPPPLFKVPHPATTKAGQLRIMNNMTILEASCNKTWQLQDIWLIPRIPLKKGATPYLVGTRWEMAVITGMLLPQIIHDVTVKHDKYSRL